MSADAGRPASSDAVEQLLRAYGVPSRRLQPRVADAFQSVEQQAVPFEDGALAAWRLGDGPAVLLVHGWEDNHSLWSPLIDALAERGRAVIAFDMPAHGCSDGEWGLYPQAIDGILEVARVLGPVDAVIAHSSGCGAAGLAMVEGVRAARAVLIAPPMRADDRFVRYAARLGYADDVAAAARRMYEERIGPDRAAFSLRTALRDLDADVLLVHSLDDERNPFGDSVDAAATCTRAQLVTVAGLAHRRTARDPGVIELVADFMSNETDIAP